MSRSLPLVLAAAAVVAACADQPTAVEPASARTQTVRDPAAGVSIDVPSEWRVQADPVLFNTYGFALFNPGGDRTGGHERSPVMRVALAYESRPDQIEGLVSSLMERNRDLAPVRAEVEVGGHRGIAVSGLPGTDSYSLIYVAAGERVYRIGMWTPERGLDAGARMLLQSIRLERPTRSVGSLGLVPVREAMSAGLPPADRMESSRAHAARVAAVAEGGGEGVAAAEDDVAPARALSVRPPRRASSGNPRGSSGRRYGTQRTSSTAAIPPPTPAPTTTCGQETPGGAP